MKNMKSGIAALMLILIMTAGVFFSYGSVDGGTYSTSPSEWAVEEVDLAQAAGIDIGNMIYRSDITRLEFARLIFRMMGIKEAEALQNNYPDEEENNNAGDEIENDSDSEFEYTVFENSEDSSAEIKAEDIDMPFIDTNDKAVIALYDKKIINGMTENTFAPYESLMREQGAAILVRVSEYFGFENPNGSPAKFYDGGQMGGWAIQDIKYISGHKTPDGKSVMGGYDNRFNPKGTYTVEEAILSVYRLYTSLDMKPSDDTSWKTKKGCILSRVILSAAGDCTLGRDLSADYSSSLDAEYDKSGGDPSIFFRNVSQFFDDDITIVNFEGTLTDSSAAASKTFRFKGRKEYTGILKSGSIDVVNIANNHSHDYLDKGYYDTLNILSAAGIGYCGYDYTFVKNVNGIKYGFYGLAPMNNGLNDSLKKSISDNIAALKAQGAMYIVGSFHWGIEKSYSPTNSQISIAHYAADCGTNLILGHHPHVLQNIERYNGVEIVYSLGNFCFGGNRNPSDKDTVVFRETVTFDIETGEIVSRERSYYPYRLSSVTNKNDYRPVPVYGAEADRIKKKLWVA